MVIARLARSVGASAIVFLAGVALLMIAFQAVSGEWSLHNTLDLGAMLVVAGSITAVTCLPIFALLGGSGVLSTRARAVLLGAASAWLTGVVAVIWLFGEGSYLQDIGDWLRALAMPLIVPFPLAGAVFGYAWSSPSSGGGNVHQLRTEPSDSAGYRADRRSSS